MSDNCCVGCFKGLGLVVVSVAIAPPVCVVALPFLGIAAIIHRIQMSYFWNKTKDEDGKPLLARDVWQYDYNEADVKKITAEDLTRLQYELKRFETQKSLDNIVELIKDVALCVMPLGLVAVLFMKTMSDPNHDDFDNAIEASARRMLTNQIGKLEREVKLIMPASLYMG